MTTTTEDPRYLVTLSADWKGGAMFCVGALIALRDLGLLQHTRLIQGVGMGNVVVAQFLHTLDQVARRYFERTKVHRSNQEHVTHRDLSSHSNQSLESAWYTMCHPRREQNSSAEPTEDPTAHQMFRPLFREFGCVNLERSLWRIWISELCAFTFRSWSSTYAHLFHSPAVPWYISGGGDDDDDEVAENGNTMVHLYRDSSSSHTTASSLEKFAPLVAAAEEEEEDSKYSSPPPPPPPVCVFSCREPNAGNRTVAYTTDRHAPLQHHYQKKELELVAADQAPSMGHILANCMLEGRWGFAIHEPTHVSCATSDPYGLRVAQTYFMRFRPKVHDSGAAIGFGLNQEQQERLDQCLLVIDGRWRSDHVNEKEDEVARWCRQALLQPTDSKHETPRLHRDQIVEMTQLPALGGTTEQQHGIQLLLKQIAEHGRNTEWTAENETLLIQCANLGHALTQYRFGTAQSRARYNKLLIENAGDPYDILPTLFPRAASAPLVHFDVGATPLPMPMPMSMHKTRHQRGNDAVYMELTEM